jgi:hypothetical protein
LFLLDLPGAAQVVQFLRHLADLLGGWVHAANGKEKKSVIVDRGQGQESCRFLFFDAGVAQRDVFAHLSRAELLPHFDALISYDGW